MSVTYSIASIVFVGMMVLGTSVASGQNYPNKPLRVFTSPAGSGIDYQSRVIAQGISGGLGQPVTVENRPSGPISPETVAKAPPDGYTLLSIGNPLWILPLLQKMPYDPVADFTPIALTTRAPNLLVVTSSLPVKSVKELIALAKARPGQLNYSSGGTGGTAHLAGELLMRMTGVKFLLVPYSNGTQETADLITGQVQLTVASATSVAAYLKAGKLRALAVTSVEPSALFPNLPTMSASGLPGYEAVSIYGMYAPAKTSAAIINRLNQEVVRVLNIADVKEKFLTAGLEIIGSSPEEHAAKIKTDMAMWGKVIKDAGIKVN